MNYSNPDHRRSDGRTCDRDSEFRPCDNIFTFEINVGDGWAQRKQFGPYGNEDDDNITFGDRLKGEDSDNPLVFTGGSSVNNVRDLGL